MFLFCVGTTPSAEEGGAGPHTAEEAFGGVDEKEGHGRRGTAKRRKFVFAGKMRSDSKRARKRQKNGEYTAGDDICHPGSSCMRCSCMILALLLFFRILVRARPFHPSTDLVRRLLSQLWAKTGEMMGNDK